jgi:hypothetical protein
LTCDALVLRHLLGHFKVHDVARVVFDDEQHALVGRHGVDRLEDLVRGGGGEDRAGHGAVQHAGADVAAVRGLMAAAAAAHESHLALFFVRPHDHVAAVQLAQGRESLDHAGDHLILDLIDLVDEFFHTL